MVQKTINMDRDLSSYVLVMKNWIDSDACKQTVREIENAQWKQHTFYNPVNGTYGAVSGSKELDITYANGLSTKKYLMQRTWDAFQQYLTDYNFAWFDSWSGFSDLRFNMYKETRIMAEHCDHIHSLFEGERKGVPTMTFLATLNKEYTGGEFVMWGDEVIPMDEGTVVVFPSNFLYPHRVDPVIKGTRFSCVSWAW